MANILQISTAGAPLYLEIAKGADFAYGMSFEVLGGAFNLTGCTLSGQVRKTYASSPVAEFAFTITDAANGKATMALTAAQTSAIPAGASSAAPGSKYVYSVQIAYADGLVASLFSGPCVVNPGALYA